MDELRAQLKRAALLQPLLGHHDKHPHGAGAGTMGSAFCSKRVRETSALATSHIFLGRP